MILCDFMRVFFVVRLPMSSCYVYVCVFVCVFFFFFLVGCRFGAKAEGGVQKYKNGATNLFTPRVFCDGILSVEVFCF